ncbi:MAG: hydroxymethylbilane synthase, partial [Euzebyales bacterium]|nr:hydroxymethylbilane synthase [Euzebyales bacterium]
MARLRIATRRSALARAQAFQTGQLITARTGADVELVAMATSGDLQADIPVGDVDVKGMFVDTIRRAVRDGDCQVAVHSYKDLPGDPAAGLVVAAVPPREDPRDILVSRDGYALSTLPPLATVGTSSERRRLQLLRAKPSLQICAVRGNVDTRLRKVADGELDAVVVAYAGLRRLYAPVGQGGLGALRLPLKGAPLEPGECLPAAAQGAIAVECRSDDAETGVLLAAVDDPVSHRAVTAERALLARFGGGCLAAVGALCTATGDGRLELLGMA